LFFNLVKPFVIIGNNYLLKAPINIVAIGKSPPAASTTLSIPLSKSAKLLLKAIIVSSEIKSSDSKSLAALNLYSEPSTLSAHISCY
jgi:hypothetical protein